MELTEGLISFFKETAANLSASPRRKFMAGIVRELGIGGQTRAEQQLGWNRQTIRKGTAELCDGVEIPDGRRNNGRLSLEEQMPTLLQDIRDVVDPHTQADPRLRTERLYRKLTTKEVRRRMVSEKGYTEKTLPSEESIRVRLDRLGYHPSRVRKTLPKKRSPKRTLSSSASVR
jgi:Rhodopirellula transposase DDE domain